MARVDTKARMVAGAVTLLREQGVAGVTIDAVLARSGAPRGSVYHHFPGGRAELVATAGRTAADYITALIRDASIGSPDAMLIRFAEFWRESLQVSDFRAGCPVVALALADLPGAADLARETFDRWQDQLAEALTADGSEPDIAASTATLVVAAIEGALILCRAQRSVEPLDRVVDRLRLQVRNGQRVPE